jgi:hypothetical protein
MQNDKLVTLNYDTFAKAAGTASALNNITRMINVEFSDGQGSSHSGCMYIYSRQDNSRRVANQHMINLVMKGGN